MHSTYIKTIQREQRETLIVTQSLSLLSSDEVKEPPQQLNPRKVINTFPPTLIKVATEPLSIAKSNSFKYNIFQVMSNNSKQCKL